MKPVKYLLAITAVIATISTSAQNNTFPTTGNVGIGTTAPASKLDLKPANANALTIRAFGTAAGNTGQLQFKELAANGNNHIAFRAPDAIASNYVFRWPANYGSNGQVLTTNGSGTLSWTTVSGGGGGGASTSLNNLVSTSINQSLVPSVTNSLDLGSGTNSWRNIYGTQLYLNGVKSLDTYNGIIKIGSTFSNATGCCNIFMGTSAGQWVTSGHNNIGIGNQAMQNNATSNLSIGIGINTLINSSNAQYNVALGHYAGEDGYNGWNNTFIGCMSDVQNNGLFNVVTLGQDCKVTGSSSVRIGNTATGSIGGFAGWSNFSDGRYKKNVKENVKGLDFIMKLRPVTYNLDVPGISERLGEQKIEELNDDMKQARIDKENMVMTGFIAQEVEAAAKGLGYDFSGVDAPRNENDLYALRYAEFVVPLVKAVQELNLQLTYQNAALEKQIEQIKSVLSEEQLMRLDELHQTKATLQQNVPNPFHKSTVINYSIPAKFNDAQLNIYSSQGVEMKSYAITQEGKGGITIEAHSLPAGVYTYTLIVDGNATDAKQMIVTK